MWVGLSETDAGLLCVSESGAFSDVLFLRMPRKSEIATGWREAEKVRGRKKKRERKE